MSLPNPRSGPGDEHSPRSDEHGPRRPETGGTRKLSIFDLIGLAAGGAIGSGWLFSAIHVHRKAGDDAVWAWVLGGVLMLVIAAVMVELSTTAPQTGGLIFLPLQSSGPLVAVVIAAGLWIFYVINAASEAVAMTRGLSHWFDGLSSAFDAGDPTAYTLTGPGLFCATVFMAVIVALNMLAQQLLLRVNFLLTVWKVLVPLLVIILLLASGPTGAGPASQSNAPAGGLGDVLAALVSGGVLYSFLGFQGPLDFAGDVREDGIGRNARLRGAVYGTILGCLVLYVLLQIVFSRQLAHATGHPHIVDSPYAQFAGHVLFGQLAFMVRVDTLLSPMGSALVFNHALTREVSTLSQERLTHWGLTTDRRSSLTLGNRRRDVYWAVLLLDFAVGLVLMLGLDGDWTTLGAITAVLSLVVYAMPCVVLVALDRHLATAGLRRRTHVVLAHVSFVAISLILYRTDWPRLRTGMIALAAGSVLLLVLPLLARWNPPLAGRLLIRYDAIAYATRFRNLRSDPAAGGAALLAGYLAVLTLYSWARSHEFPTRLAGAPGHYLAAGVVAVTAVGALRGLVALSVRKMREVPPRLATVPEQPREPVTTGGQRPRR